MATQSPAQGDTVERVMHEFKHGDLKSAGHTVRNKRQAIAIGLSEAGASRDKTPKQNKKALAHTKAGERKAKA